MYQSVTVDLCTTFQMHPTEKDLSPATVMRGKVYMYLTNQKQGTKQEPSVGVQLLRTIHAESTGCETSHATTILFIAIARAVSCTSLMSSHLSLALIPISAGVASILSDNCDHITLL